MHFGTQIAINIPTYLCDTDLQSVIKNMAPAQNLEVISDTFNIHNL